MINKKSLLRKKQVCTLLFLLFFYSFTAKVYSCEMPNTSIAYFKPFSVQTYVPVIKEDFEGYKVVIKDTHFKDLLDKAKVKKDLEFIENVRITVNFDNKIYYLNAQGEIELNNSAIGKLDKEARNHLDLGYDLYEWNTCRPMNEVLAEMLQEHNKHMEERMKKPSTIIYKGTNKN